MIGVMAVLLLTSANAEVVTIWDKATEIMTDLYDRLLLISTLAAIVTAAFALVMNRRRISCMAKTNNYCLGSS